MTRLPLLRVFPFAALLALGVTAGAAEGSTCVSGPVSGVWTAGDSPYVVVDTISVSAGENLRIEAGVEVLFAGAYPLIVHGGLQAVGVEADSVTFAPLDGESPPWSGIRFFEAAPGCSLLCCRITGSRVSGGDYTTGCGGAIFSVESSPLIASSRIHDCESEYWEFTEGFGGGAIFCAGGEPQIIGNRITDCYAEASCIGGGGGICVWQSDATIEGNEILRCSAHGLGGGLSVTASTVEISGNVIAGCSGFHFGGGIAVGQACMGRIFDNLFVNNDAPDLGGGGIYVVSSGALEISFCTLAGNNAGSDPFGSGGALYVVGASPRIRNCILWGNTSGAGTQIEPAGLDVQFCDVEGGYPGSGNFSSDPLFVESGGGGAGSDCYLSCCEAGQGSDSPCIDAGNQSSGIAGVAGRTTRTDLLPDTGTADLGYHYFTPRVVEVPGSGSPERRALVAAPNPFRDRTTIFLSGSATAGRALRIFDPAGRLVRVLDLPAGGSELAEWDGRDASGRPVAPGVYLVRTDPAGSQAGEGAKLVLCR
jgi:hypothetical protein